MKNTGRVFFPTLIFLNERQYYLSKYHKWFQMKLTCMCLMAYKLRAVFVQLLGSFLRHFGNSSSPITRISFTPHQLTPSEGAGRPSVNIPFELLTYEVLVSPGKNCKNVSCLPLDSNAQSTIIWIAMLTTFSSITDEQIDGIIHAYISNHGNTTGESYMRGHFRALGYYVPRRRGRAGINRVIA
jgi:hypothetical protein